MWLRSRKTLMRLYVLTFSRTRFLERLGRQSFDVLRCTQFNTGVPTVTASTTMTIRVSPEVKQKLDRIATDTRRSKSFLAGEAVAAYVERELEIIDGIKRGMADAAAGRVIPHDQAVAEMRAVIEDAKRRKAAQG